MSVPSLRRLSIDDATGEVRHGRDPFELPGTSAAALRDTVRETVRDTVRDGVRNAARETSAEVKQRATAGVHTPVTRTEEAVAAAALTSKIKAKMPSGTW